MKNLLFIILLSLMWGCSPDYRIEQKVDGSVEYIFSTNDVGGNQVVSGVTEIKYISIKTTAHYKNVRIYNVSDRIYIGENDSIKCFRYNEAMAKIEEYKYFNNIKCN